MTVRDTLTAIVRQWGAPHGTADDLGEQIADAYRAEVMREAADFLEEIGTPITGERTEHERGVMYASERLRRMADGAAPCPDIHHSLTRPHTTTECPKDGDPS